VVGTGASGIQVIPEMAKVAKHVVVFQRCKIINELSLIFSTNGTVLRDLVTKLK
jgi:hypothetical protein